MSEWGSCLKCGVMRENLCACTNPQCPDFSDGSRGPRIGVLETIMQEILRHDAEHPAHGAGCACHDGHAAAIRRLVKVYGMDQPEHRKSLVNFLIVLGYFTRNP